MTNKLRQELINRKKWIDSEKAGVDLSGNMDICEYCSAYWSLICVAPQNERDRECLCAIAYNRWDKARRKNVHS